MIFQFQFQRYTLSENISRIYLEMISFTYAWNKIGQILNLENFRSDLDIYIFGIVHVRIYIKLSKYQNIPIAPEIFSFYLLTVNSSRVPKNVRLAVRKFSTLQEFYRYPKSSELFSLRNSLSLSLPSIAELVTTTVTTNFPPICIESSIYSTFATAAAVSNGKQQQQHRLQYCACHNPGALLTRRFRLSFSPRSPAIWTSRRKSSPRSGIGQFAGALKSYVHIHTYMPLLPQFWQTRWYHARHDKSTPEVDGTRNQPNEGARRVAVIRNDDDDAGRIPPWEIDSPAKCSLANTHTHTHTDIWP